MHNFGNSVEINNFIYTFGITIFVILISAVLIWSMIWKGIALWKAAKNGSRLWFIFFLIINTLGILEILYIYVFSKKSLTKKQKVSGMHTVD